MSDQITWEREKELKGLREQIVELRYSNYRYQKALKTIATDSMDECWQKGLAQDALKPHPTGEVKNECD